MTDCTAPACRCRYSYGYRGSHCRLAHTVVLNAARLWTSSFALCTKTKSMNACSSRRQSRCASHRKRSPSKLGYGYVRTFQRIQKSEHVSKSRARQGVLPISSCIFLRCGKPEAQTTHGATTRGTLTGYNFVLSQSDLGGAAVRCLSSPHLLSPI